MVMSPDGGGDQGGTGATKQLEKRGGYEREKGLRKTKPVTKKEGPFGGWDKEK